MKPMTGEIGKLSINGNQVGGFKYWTAIQNRNSLQTIVRASRFWLFEKVDTNTFQADFYSHNPDGNLHLVYSVPVTVDLPEYESDKMMSKILTFDLGMFDWMGGVGNDSNRAKVGNGSVHSP